jgi:hypothetical protein
MLCYYAKLENNQIVEFPIYQGDLKILVGFDDTSGEEFQTPEGYVAVEDTDPPQFPFDYEKTLREKTPEQIDGVWTRVWAIEDATEQELQFRIQKKSEEIRKKRNQLLSETDWTQLLNSPVDSNIWAIYRQELRDIPEQEGFPWEIQWPELPMS